LARRTQPASLVWPNGRLGGRLRYDAVVNGRMHILSTWLLTTSDGQVAARIAALGCDSLSWPHHDGLKWPHLAGRVEVVVTA
jgi:hypothetical protein